MLGIHHICLKPDDDGSWNLSRMLIITPAGALILSDILYFSESTLLIRVHSSNTPSIVLSFVDTFQMNVIFKNYLPTSFVLKNRLNNTIEQNDSYNKNRVY